MDKQAAAVIALAEEVVRLVEENPDFIYETPPSNLGKTCLYTRSKNNPVKGCLLGQAVENTGVVPRHTLEIIDSKSGMSFMALMAREREDIYNHPDLRYALRLLTNAQSSQDAGHAWGNIQGIDELKKEIERLKAWHK